MLGCRLIANGESGGKREALAVFRKVGGGGGEKGTNLGSGVEKGGKL